MRPIVRMSAYSALLYFITACVADTPPDSAQISFANLDPQPSSQKAPQTTGSQAEAEQGNSKVWRLTADQIRLSDNMELAPHRARMSSHDRRATVDVTPEGGAQAQALSDADETWRDANGQRYEALLVLEDGTVFGRKGAAPPREQPTAENNYGGWKGVDPTNEDLQHAIEELDRAHNGASSEEERSRLGTIERPQAETAIIAGNLTGDRRLRQGGLWPLQSYPGRTIGALNQTTFAGGLPGPYALADCTGTKVGPRHVLTAAHCVLDDEGEWTSSGYFHPGQTNATHPNAGGAAVRWSGVYARDYRGVASDKGRFDYALVYLEDRQNSVNLGWVGMSYWTGASNYASKNVTISGYPLKSAPYPSHPTAQLDRCLASLLGTYDCDGWMYAQSNALTMSSFGSNEQLGYDIDTTVGQSGSSVLWSNAGSVSTLGVHWGTYDGLKNYAARLRASMHADICDWINNVTSVWGTNPC